MAWIEVTLLLFLSILFIILETGPWRKQQQKVLLFMIDGMRWDIFGMELPNFQHIQDTGVKSDWLDGAYLSMSTPSMMTIATGLYPESHGIVHNCYYNAEYKNRTYDFGITLNITDWFDTGTCEPIWVTAINQGLKAATILYPGGNVPINGVRPNTNIPNAHWFWENYSLKSRVDTALSLMTEDGIDLVMLYSEKPDTVLHDYGIGSPQAEIVLKEIDDTIGYLLKGIEEHKLSDTLNVIVVSDHGHSNQNTSQYVLLYDYINETDVDFILGNYGPVFQLLPKPGKLEKIYNLLVNAHPALNVFKKEEFPARLHYANHPRILPILGFVDPGWFLSLNETNGTFYAEHNYDTQWMDMKSIFYAKGPSFKKGHRSPNFESVNVYPLMCELLGINPSPNNGSTVYTDMLQPKQLSSASFTVIGLFLSVIIISLVNRFI